MQGQNQKKSNQNDHKPYRMPLEKGSGGAGEFPRRARRFSRRPALRPPAPFGGTQNPLSRGCPGAPIWRRAGPGGFGCGVLQNGKRPGQPFPRQAPSDVRPPRRRSPVPPHGFSDGRNTTRQPPPFSRLLLPSLAWRAVSAPPLFLGRRPASHRSFQPGTWIFQTACHSAPLFYPKKPRHHRRQGLRPRRAAVLLHGADVRKIGPVRCAHGICSGPKGRELPVQAAGRPVFGESAGHW